MSQSTQVSRTDLLTHSTNVLAYEFIAHDRAGMTLAGVTDGGTCEWVGTREQWSDAEAHIAYFEENGAFIRNVEDFAPYND